MLKRLATIILILLAIFIVYLIAAGINNWWPFEDEANDSGANPTPTPTATAVDANATPTPTLSPNATPTPTPYIFGKRINDNAREYELSISSDWTLVRSEGRNGKQISYIEIDSPNFDLRHEYNSSGDIEKTYYKDGARLMVHVVSGNFPQVHETEGGNPETGIINTETRFLGGSRATYHEYVHPTTYEGKLLDLHLQRNNKTYLLTFAYKESRFPRGKQMFDDIIMSFQFTD